MSDAVPFPIVPVALAVAWLAVGAVVGVVEARRGYWRHGWILTAVFGPLAVPLAHQRRRSAVPGPVVLARGVPGTGTIDVLVGTDGSPASRAAAHQAVDLFGPRLRRITLATVIDRDSAAPHSASLLHPEPWPEEVAARQLLAGEAADLAATTGRGPETVILAGNPAEALERHACDHGFQVLVVGCRGEGATKLILGSCASHLASGAAVPVLLVAPDRGLAARSA